MNQSPIRQDEEAYWRFARDLVRVWIADVNSELDRQGLDASTRRKMCETIVFAISNRLDTSWLRSEENASYPSVCFTDRSLADSNGQTQILLRSDSVELHAMVGDEVEWFFDRVGQQLPDDFVGSGDPPPDKSKAQVDEEAASDPLIRFPCHPCDGTGHCFCIRKGPGKSTGCPRCEGTGQCRHCRGRGTTNE